MSKVTAGLPIRVNEDALAVTREGPTLVLRLAEGMMIGEADAEALVTDIACGEAVIVDMLGAGLLVLAILLVLNVVVVELLVVDVD